MKINRQFGKFSTADFRKNPIFSCMKNPINQEPARSVFEHSKVDDKIFAVQHDGNLTLLFYFMGKWVMCELTGEQLAWEDV